MLLWLMRLYDAPAYHADRTREELTVFPAEPETLSEAELLAQCQALLTELARRDVKQGVVIV